MQFEDRNQREMHCFWYTHCATSVNAVQRARDDRMALLFGKARFDGASSNFLLTTKSKRLISTFRKSNIFFLEGLEFKFLYCVYVGNPYHKPINFLLVVQKVLKPMHHQELWGNKMSQRQSNDMTCILGSSMEFISEAKPCRGGTRR